MKIRMEEPKDYAEIGALIKAAFEKEEHSDGTEAELVNRLRNSEAYIPELALLAESEGKIRGYILFTLIRIDGKKALAVGPLAVWPDDQRSGIGSALIHAGHEKAKAMGYDLCVLVGHAEYYPRFGYRKACTLGIQTHLPIPDENFLACPLCENLECFDGMLHYPDAWGLHE